MLSNVRNGFAGLLLAIIFIQNQVNLQLSDNAKLGGCFVPSVVNGTLLRKGGETYSSGFAPFGTILTLRCNRNFVATRGVAEIKCDQLSSSWTPSNLAICRYQPANREKIVYEASLWDNASVAYDFSTSLDNKTQIEMIESAIELVNAKTCFKFRQAMKGVDHVFIEFVPDDTANRCTSSFGQVAESKQTIQLADGCFADSQRLYFAIMSTIGLVQEHRRPDRNDYIEIVWENILDNAKFLFETYDDIDPHLLAIPYDYSSVMHFSANEHAKAPGLVTIRAKKPDAPASFGGNTPTDLDYRKVSALYCFDRAIMLMANASSSAALKNESDSTTATARAIATATTSSTPTTVGSVKMTTNDTIAMNQTQSHTTVPIRQTTQTPAATTVIMSKMNTQTATTTHLATTSTLPTTQQNTVAATTLKPTTVGNTSTRNVATTTVTHQSINDTTSVATNATTAFLQTTTGAATSSNTITTPSAPPTTVTHVATTSAGVLSANSSVYNNESMAALVTTTGATHQNLSVTSPAMVILTKHSTSNETLAALVTTTVAPHQNLSVTSPAMVILTKYSTNNETMAVTTAAWSSERNTSATTVTPSFDSITTISQTNSTGSSNKLTVSANTTNEPMETAAKSSHTTSYSKAMEMTTPNSSPITTALPPTTSVSQLNELNETTTTRKITTLASEKNETTTNSTSFRELATKNNQTLNVTLITTESSVTNSSSLVDSTVPSNLTTTAYLTTPYFGATAPFSTTSINSTTASIPNVTVHMNELARLENGNTTYSNITASSTNLNKTIERNVTSAESTLNMSRGDESTANMFHNNTATFDSAGHVVNVTTLAIFNVTTEPTTLKPALASNWNVTVVANVTFATTVSAINSSNSSSITMLHILRTTISSQFNNTQI